MCIQREVAVKSPAEVNEDTTLLAVSVELGRSIVPTTDIELFTLRFPSTSIGIPGLGFFE